jgi:hypothetical protein
MNASDHIRHGHHRLREHRRWYDSSTQSFGLYFVARTCSMYPKTITSVRSHAKLVPAYAIFSRIDHMLNIRLCVLHADHQFMVCTSSCRNFEIPYLHMYISV